jgi:hypothetical protein
MSHIICSSYLFLDPLPWDHPRKYAKWNFLFFEVCSICPDFSPSTLDLTIFLILLLDKNITFNNLHFGAGRTMIKNVILFYVIFNIIIF